ncbi:MAG: NADH-quinone oxidoreductase subunit A [Candidatus Sulfotelmatobacter sp.]
MAGSDDDVFEGDFSSRPAGYWAPLSSGATHPSQRTHPRLGTSHEMLVNGQTETLWTLGVYFVVVLLLVAAMLAISYVLGQRHNERATGSPYESGILSEGSARVRLSAKFYLVAMFFVIFDLEAVFIFAWAVAARELGWAGYREILVFIAILVAALAYLWRLGALDWGSSRHVTRVRH